MRTLGFLTTVALAVACFAAILTPASVCVRRPPAFDPAGPSAESPAAPQQIGDYIPPASPATTSAYGNACRRGRCGQARPYNRAKTRLLHDHRPRHYSPAPAASLAAPTTGTSTFGTAPAMAAVVGATASVFGRAIVMPNLRPPVTTTAMALAYRDRIARRAARGRALRAAADALPHRPHERGGDRRGQGFRVRARGEVLPGWRDDATRIPASPRSSARIPRSRRCRSAGSCCRCTARSRIRTSTCSIASACSSTAISTRIVRDFPALKIVLEHVTTREAAEFVAAAPANVAATITPQHLLWSRNALFAGGLRPHFYCMPILKREAHREALVRAATSGQPEVLPRHRFRAARAPREGKRVLRRRLLFGARLRFRYTPRRSRMPAHSTDSKASRVISARISTGLPRNADTVTLVRETWTRARRIPFGNDALVPLRAGETVRWQVGAEGTPTPR